MHQILYSDRNYHGTGSGGMNATDQAQRKRDFGPFFEGVVEFPIAHVTVALMIKNTVDATLIMFVKWKTLYSKKMVAPSGLIVEPITGGSGTLKPPGKTQ